MYASAIRTAPARFTPGQVVDIGLRAPGVVVADNSTEWYGQRKGWVVVKVGENARPVKVGEVKSA